MSNADRNICFQGVRFRYVSLYFIISILTDIEIFRRPGLFTLILEAVKTKEVLCRKIHMPAKFISANHIAPFEGRKPIQIEVVNKLVLLTDFQVCTGKYKALVSYAQPSATRRAVLEN